MYIHTLNMHLLTGRLYTHIRLNNVINVIPWTIFHDYILCNNFLFHFWKSRITGLRTSRVVKFINKIMSWFNIMYPLKNFIVKRSRFIFYMLYKQVSWMCFFGECTWIICAYNLPAQPTNLFVYINGSS